MSKLDLNFSCSNCGATHAIQMLTGENRKTWYRPGYEVTIPNYFKLPTCTKCGDWFYTEEITERLYPILRRKYLHNQKNFLFFLLEDLKEKTKSSAHTIITAGCGIRYGKFKQYLDGIDVIPIPLHRLLQAFQKYPDLCIDRIEERKKWIHELDK